MVADQLPETDAVAVGCAPNPTRKRDDMSAGDTRVRQYSWNGYRVVKVGAGIRHIEHVTPPADPDHAFDIITHPLEVEICTSPTDRSTRLWINGVEIDWRLVVAGAR